MVMCLANFFFFLWDYVSEENRQPVVRAVTIVCASHARTVRAHFNEMLSGRLHGCVTSQISCFSGKTSSRSVSKTAEDDIDAPGARSPIMYQE